MRIGQVIAKWRWAERLSLRELAALTGISAATLMRVEKGEGMDGETLAILLRWLLQPAVETSYRELPPEEDREPEQEPAEVSRSGRSLDPIDAALARAKKVGRQR